MTTTPPTSGNILVIEDDPSIQLGLKMALGNAGHRVSGAEDGASGLELARSQPWDLVILDVMLPKLNGYEILKAIRSSGLTVPVLMLSARGGERDKVNGLDLGAEDYITKPFGVPELLARVRALLRRRNSAPRLAFGELIVDPQRREVRRDGALIELTVTEYNVLWALVRANGRPLDRTQIFQAVWGTGHHGTHRTIDNFVAQLRGKLERDPGNPRHLVTVRGVGYRFE